MSRLHNLTHTIIIKCLRSLLLLPLLAALFLTSNTFAQTATVSNHILTCAIPPGGKSPCTSKDLEIVGISIDAPLCTTCTPGQTVTYPLKMTIHNGTNSERTSFALYGTLSSGASIDGRSGDIFVCVGPITVKSNQTLAGETAPGNQTFLVGSITFRCGAPLTLKNNYLAWTDAAGNTADRCNTFLNATSCASIAPKCGTAASITIRGAVFPPTITSIAPACSAAGSSTISNYSASNTYAFTPSGPSVGTGGLISGMTVGTSYTVTSNDGSCTSAASGSFSNAVRLVTPATPTITSGTAACSAEGNSIISNYSASNTYAFTPSGPSVGTGGLISGMTVGTSYTVTSNNGSCTSAASGSFSNAARLVTPATPTITSGASTCTAAGSSTISNYSASNTYTFAPLGPTITLRGLINSMTVGTPYTVISNDGSCTSAASGSFSNAARLVTPATPTITSGAATCSAEGNSTISNYSASNTYTFTPLGPTITSGGLINSMTVGTPYTVTSNNGSCTSAASASFSNAAMLVTPATPTITSGAATCSAEGNSTISNYSASNTYTFTPLGPTITSGGLINSMTVGTPYTVTSNNGSCTSAASASFSNAAMLETPTFTVCVVQPTLCSTGSLTINASGGSGFLCTIDGSEPNANNTNNVFSNLGVGSVTTIKVKNSSGCSATTPVNCSDIVSNCSPPPNGRTAAPVTQVQSVDTIKEQAVESQVQGLETIEAQISSPTKVTAAPNPFSDRVRFSLVSAVSGQGTLDLFNTMGQRVQRVFQGYVEKGIRRILEYNVASSKRGNLIYVFTVGDQKTTGILINLK